MEAAVFFVLVWHSALICSGSIIVVDPPTHQFVPVNSTENVTFTCDVTGGNALPARDAVWAVLQRQIPNDENSQLRDDFANIGIFVDVLEEGVTVLTITSEARMLYLTGTPPTQNITVMCAAFSSSSLPIGEEGDQINVTTFDSPSIPTGLSLLPDSEGTTQLIFSWVAPADTLSGVVVTYTPTITDISLGQTNSTFIKFPNDASLNCIPRLFSVFASNDAGVGPTAFITETIPISPDITILDMGFQLTQVSLDTNITIMFSFPPAQSCNPGFRISNYSLFIPSVLERELLNVDDNDVDIVMTLEVPGLVRDRIFEVFIETCIEINCRQSRARTFRTTDVQTAAIVFFQTNIFVTCVFALESDAVGCVLQLELANGEVDAFPVARSGVTTTQCLQSPNQRDAYVNLTVFDLEDGEDMGTVPFVVTQPTLLDDADSYTEMTGCGIPEPAEALSAGAIIGIVFAALIVASVLLVVAVLLLVYRVETGYWFKLREKDEEKLTVHFEKELLMGDVKPKKKSKVSATFTAGRDHPDNVVVGKGSGTVVADSAIEEHDAGDTTNPDAAFTLDISSDRRKVRLHLNRALIKRVLQDKNLNTMDRRKARRQISMGKQHLLPLHCEVRVQVDEEQN